MFGKTTQAWMFYRIYQAAGFIYLAKHRFWVKMMQSHTKVHWCVIDLDTESDLCWGWVDLAYMTIRYAHRATALWCIQILSICSKWNLYTHPYKIHRHTLRWLYHWRFLKMIFTTERWGYRDAQSQDRLHCDFRGQNILIPVQNLEVQEHKYICQKYKVQICWSADLLKCRFAKVQICWSADFQKHRYAKVQIC